MANPSLQIGNSNWAIKEDNLLGYSTVGTRFVPQPITMTRESAGTRVNSSGLVETVELLGSEEVTDGNFPTPNTEWTAFGLATINENIVNFVDAGSNTYSGITQDINSFSAKQYKVEITVTNWISGDILATFSSNNASFNITGNGTYSVYITPVSNGDDIGLVRDYSSGADFSYSITNVSVKESTKNNLARVDYDGTSSSLLVEPQRTNLITYSEDFSNADWTKQAGIIPTYNTTETLSPDGTYNATKFVGNGSAGIYKTGASVSGVVARTVYLKSITGTVNVILKDPNRTITSKSLTLTEEWQRFELIESNGTSLQGIWIDDIPVSGVYMWGAQLEAGSYATSYIPTDGSTVTRVQDQYSKTGISNLINSEEGVLFVEIAALDNNLSSNKIISLSDGTTSNRLLIYYTNIGNTIKWFSQVGGSIQVDDGVVLSDITQFSKIAFKYKLNDYSLWVDGVEVGSYTSGSSFPTDTLNSLALDGGGGASKFFGKVKQLQIYKTTDIDLAALTS